MSLAAILFDLDNTLVDRDRALREVLEAALQGRADAAAQIARILARDGSGHTDRRALGRWLRAEQPELLELLPRSEDEVGQDPDDAAWLRLRAAMLARIGPDAATRALLEALAGRFRLGLISNGGAATQRHKLRRSGLADLFEPLLISAEQGCAKPAPEIFARALARLDVAPDRVLMVGDHPEQDVVGARDAGLRTCWVAAGRAYPAGLPEPDLQIDSLAGLPGVLP